MRFEEYKGGTLGFRTHAKKLYVLVSDFIKSGFEVAEVKDWEDDYASAGSVYSSLRKVIMNHYNGQCHVSKANNDRIFLVRD